MNKNNLYYCILTLQYDKCNCVAGYLLVIIIILLLLLLQYYSLDVFSLFHRLIYMYQYRIKNIWLPPGIEPRTAWGTAMLQSHSQQTNEISLFLYIYICINTAMLQSHSQQTNKISLFLKKKRNFVGLLRVRL